MARSAARRYADAIVSLANEQDSFEAWDRDLGNLAGAMSDPQTARFLVNPGVPVVQKRQVIDTLLQGASPEARNLMNILIERQRLNILPDLYAAFQSAWLDVQGIVLADVTTADPLSPSDLQHIERQLEQMVGKQIRMQTSVDPDLIGGFVARVGDQLLDGSVRTKLRELRGRLVAGL